MNTVARLYPVMSLEAIYSVSTPFSLEPFHQEVVPSYAISLATDLATVRFSQGLVHSLTATSEVMKGVACAGVMVFSHYLICNDTLEEIHLGQVSIN